MRIEEAEVRITLRLPAYLHARLVDAAEESARSMNGEIVARLEETFYKSGQYEVAQKEMSELSDRLTYQQGVIDSLRHGLQVFIKHLARGADDERKILDAVMAELNSDNPPRGIE